MKYIPGMIIVMALILGSYRGYVALLDSGVPIETYPLPVQMLPQNDQEKLAEGIPILGQTHLENLLQDYLS